MIFIIFKIQKKKHLTILHILSLHLWRIEKSLIGKWQQRERGSKSISYVRERHIYNLFETVSDENIAQTIVSIPFLVYDIHVSVSIYLLL